GSGGADLWERKYLLLGMQEYYAVTGDKRVLGAMTKLADYTLSQIGDPPKTPITSTGWAFFGIESSSILEPMMKLYALTGERRFLDFGEYIFKSGACQKENIFAAVASGKNPRDIGSDGVPEHSIAKAYEMMSCFEGVLELYRATGEKKYLDVSVKFWELLMRDEITLLGSGGADKPYNLGPGTGEQWNFTRHEQTNPDITLMMETCVTVTWLKLCHKLLRVTGDSRYADCVERSAFNLIPGAIRPDGGFFEYFPRFNGVRNPKVNFSYKVGDIDLSCCTANGPMGLAYVPFTAYMAASDGVCINFYTNSQLELENGVSLTAISSFPAQGRTLYLVSCERETRMKVYFRVPDYARDTFVTVNSVKTDYLSDSSFPGYGIIERVWENGDFFTVNFDIVDYAYISPNGSNRAGDAKIAFVHGALVLARDARYEDDIDAPVEIPSDWLVPDSRHEITLTLTPPKSRCEGCKKAEECRAVNGGMGDAAICIGDSDGDANCQSDPEEREKIKNEQFMFEWNSIPLIDYASAGSTWDERSRFAVWSRT
ncbi:MAG: beta-L-arabinofuranosidase domain-containing protein, partial [Eubacteriales bacterium]